MPVQTPKIVFLGTPEFAVPVLLKLIKSGLPPFLVITQPDKPAGRHQVPTPPPVKILAQAHGLKIAQPENKKQLAEIFKNLECDVCVLVAYGQILPPAVLEKPKFGILNIHPSLLPKYRGSSPIQTAIYSGENITGVSIIKLSDRVDAGPVLGQVELPIGKNDTAETLHQKLAEAGSELLLQVLPPYLAEKIFPRPQDESRVTFSKMLERHDGEIDWSKSAPEIDRQFRAFFPWPGIFTHLAGKRLKIAKLSLAEGDFGSNLSFGEVFLSPDGELMVKCGSGAVRLEEVQLEGKKTIKGSDFALGQKIVGQILK